MDKKIKIAIGIGAAAVVGFLLYTKMKDKKKKVGQGKGESVKRPTGTEYGVDSISPDDLKYIKDNSKSKFVTADFKGVDYTDKRNTVEANQTYLIANPDIEKNWADKDAEGNTVGWSHYVIWGQGEGRKWSTDV